MSRISQFVPERQCTAVLSSAQLQIFSPILQLSIQPVARDIAIAPDRFYLTLDYNGDRWSYPIQLTQQEICQLIEQAQKLTLLGGVA